METTNEKPKTYSYFGDKTEEKYFCKVFVK